MGSEACDVDPALWRSGTQIAVDRLMDRLWSGRRTDDADYLQEALDAYRAGRGRRLASALDLRLRDQRFGTNRTAHSATRGRRLGRPVIELESMELVPDVLVPWHREDGIDVNQVVVVRRERNVVAEDRMDSISCPAHLALSRHAIERIHERSLEVTDDLRLTLLDEMPRADDAIAFACSAGIILGSGIGSMTCVPMLDGLIFAEQRVIGLRTEMNPSSWYEVRRTGIFRRQVSMNPETTIPLPDVDGHPMTGHRMQVAATYVSGDMLSVLQEGYRDWFIRMMEDHAASMPAVRIHWRRDLHAHRTPPEAPSLVVPDIGRRLLREISAPSVRRPTVLSTGWAGNEHRSRWPRRPTGGCGRSSGAVPFHLTEAAYR